MGVRIAYDPIEDVAVMYDSVSGAAFGPVFEHDGGTERCQAFLESLPHDAREYGDLDLAVLRNQWTLDNPRRDE